MIESLDLTGAPFCRPIFNRFICLYIEKVIVVNLRPRGYSYRGRTQAKQACDLTGVTNVATYKDFFNEESGQ